MSATRSLAFVVMMQKVRIHSSEPGTFQFSQIAARANGSRDFMAVIIPPEAYDRWLSPIEPGPRNLLVPYPSEPMTMWPISTRVNKPENDDPAILEPVEVGGGSPSLL